MRYTSLIKNCLYALILMFLFFPALINSHLSEGFAENNKPLKAIIIGGGPSGLAAATEAKLAGFEVTVVEKRESYNRIQLLILNDTSIKLLRKWGIKVPQNQIFDFPENHEEGIQFFFTPICDLERALDARVKELGIKKINGTFEQLDESQKALIKTPEADLLLPYDILVGADGSHSLVRRCLDISTNYFGSAQGILAIIPSFNDFLNQEKISSICRRGNTAFRLFKFSKVITTVIAQNPLSGKLDDLIPILESLGLKQELQAVNMKSVAFIEDIPISLQQSTSFSNERMSAIIIGDAAATGSFISGLGANTCFREVEMAGRFFEHLKTNPKDAFKHFNQEMNKLTTELIEKSEPLFSNET
jgi:2-polyprenyl-6-methoxyphenol hydroxylase-like FAD-dependent oxidoreductase